MSKSIKTYRFDSNNVEKFIIPVLSDYDNYEYYKRILSKSKFRCLLINSKSGQFRNLITQGDMLRYELKNKEKHNLEDLLLFKGPCRTAATAGAASLIARSEGLTIVPIKKISGKLDGIVIRYLDKLGRISSIISNKRIALIVAGGKGTRLGKITKETPKPLIEIAGKPIIEHVMCSIEFLGFKEFHLLCGHMVEKFNLFSKKTRFDVKVNSEDKPLGTGGPFIKWVKDNQDNLSYHIENKGTVHIIIANGDLLFDLESDTYSKFEESKGRLCMVSRKLKNPLKYGTIETNKDKFLKKFVEKPTLEYKINTGIYFISIDKELLDLMLNLNITNVSMPDLLIMISKKLKVQINVIEIDGNYLDVGTPEDLMEFIKLTNE